MTECQHATTVLLPDFTEIDAARSFRRYSTTDAVVYMSGHIGDVPKDGFPVGCLGDPVTVDEGYAAARAACLNLLASIDHAASGLVNVRSIIKIVGFVACAPAFRQLSEVVDGASDLLVEVLGAQRGNHARSAIGVSALPTGAPVEVEAIVSIGPA